MFFMKKLTLYQVKDLAFFLYNIFVNNTKGFNMVKILSKEQFENETLL